MPATASRREILRAGLAGFGMLSLPGMLRLREASAKAATPRERTAVIVVWLRGGCSHLDTYDPKPDAPSEFRGPFATIETKTPGLRFTELIPRQAAISDRFTVLRSLAHTGGGHPAGSLQLLSGDPDAQDKQGPKYPDFMSVAHYLRSDVRHALPNYIGVNPITRYDSFQIAGPAYLGGSYEPFALLGDPSAPNFRVPNVGLDHPSQADRLRGRLRLSHSFDDFRRDLDASGTVDAIDRFESQALDLLTSPEAARAFDLSREDPKLRERYGLNQWGQQCLMARRLVEAGVEVVTTTFDGPLCGRVANWDDHAVNHHVFDALKFRASYFDQAVAALIEDVYARGLDKRVLVVVTGEFGRTPRISYVASSGGGQASAPAGTVQPGRDHWPRANSMIWAGGGIATGRVIGGTDRRGEDVTDRRVGPQDFLATIYQHLGIDYASVTIPDHAGRPTPIVTNGQAIPELIATA
ncbi:DUF1501 domain-containing protein [Singulisphaera acidiphila]|uniref:DUF1501 domain-containing protein n=1 Tax=Singulisphaera acidiphila (strain ATCC BAA-1392 / DSM 18658 / VKM B-2454 / MOB10) TaxID=886293 RepID=L0D5I1_SINAD|nr:DUF1501 domain-containing protein [Singulisphaera acidiphila]AGA24512.1 hypothetical protein Sinac_0050 [Singulisphaera acidiphila DSM 18658]